MPVELVIHAGRSSLEISQRDFMAELEAKQDPRLTDAFDRPPYPGRRGSDFGTTRI